MGKRIFSEEHKQKLSDSKKGNKNPMYGTHGNSGSFKKGQHASSSTEFQSGRSSQNKGKYGSEHPKYNGGRKVAVSRSNTKRRCVRKQFGFIPLNECKEDGWVGHHIDKDYVIFIPEELHKNVWHSQKNQDSMDRINDVVYEWFVNYYLKEQI